MLRSTVAAKSLWHIARRLPRAAATCRLPSTSSARIHVRNYAAAASKPAERFEFQAETKNLLDIVAKSLYSDQEVFIRELVSNASDALEKRRCVHLTSGDDTNVAYEIKITTDESAKKLVFEDNGIGMDREDLVKCLGTIAKSGSKEFMDEQKSKEASKASAESIIGQFGVGFYSAFMVANSVTVSTRKEGSNVGYIWRWNGADEYSIEETDALNIGTKVEIELKPGDASEFAKPQRVIDVINKYSYFITLPITVNGERVNTLNAIWTMNPNEVTSEMHETFFRQLAKTHLPHLITDRPQYTIHYKTDAPINVRSLLYVPSHNVSTLEFASGTEDSGVSLYARRVLIKANAKQLLPRYLRFLVGVVDSEDIPLNLSREMLQMDAVLVKLRRVLTDKVVSFFLTQMKKDRIKYGEFYKGYSLFFKEGLCIEQDQGVKETKREGVLDWSEFQEQIASLLLFESSSLKPGVKTSLSEYVDRMQEGQNEIYYLFAPNRQLAEHSPYFEMFKSQNREVLFAYEAADETVFLSLPQYRMKQLKSVDNWAKTEGTNEQSTESMHFHFRQLAEHSPYFEMFKSQNREVLFAYEAADETVLLSLPQYRMKQLKSVDNWAKTEGTNEQSTETTTIRDADKKDLLDWMKTTLGSVKVYEIKSTNRISDHPCMITVRTEMGMARHLLRIGQIKDMEHLVFLQPTLHVNLNHPVISALVKLHKSDPKLAQMVVEQIYDNALVTSGLMKDSSQMIERINRLLSELLKPAKSAILTP
uniref:Histidine kinase/HSP90-like ATPase domain-containing protein n=1 Tax=Ascaris lumbricoides TaxID=6252 RepID=A0A9J2P7J7_ASCLU